MSVRISQKAQIALLQCLIANDRQALAGINSRMAKLHREYFALKREADALELHIDQNEQRLIGVDHA